MFTGKENDDNNAFSFKKQIILDWRCGSVVQHMLNMCKALGSIFSTTRSGGTHKKDYSIYLQSHSSEFTASFADFSLGPH